MSVRPMSSVSVRMKLEIEINIGSSWGADCSLEQIYDQSKTSAINSVTCALRKNDITPLSVKPVSVFAVSNIGEVK